MKHENGPANLQSQVSGWIETTNDLSRSRMTIMMRSEPGFIGRDTGLSAHYRFTAL